MLTNEPAMALDGRGSLLPYYWGKFFQINFQTGETIEEILEEE